MINSHTHEPQTEIIPLNEMMGLKKFTIFFYATTSNTLPWAFVEGNISNHIEKYPVIIQFSETIQFTLHRQM